MRFSVLVTLSLAVLLPSVDGALQIGDDAPAIAAARDGDGGADAE